MKTETISQVECNRCGYRWFPRSLKTPKFCSKCNSPYWNKERVRESKDVGDKNIEGEG